MNHSSTDPVSAASRALEREVTLVESAIEMVAQGHASRMQLGGLSFGDALLDHARRVGAARRVRVTPRWGLGEEGLALVFEPADADADTGVPHVGARCRPPKSRPLATRPMMR